jgi:lipopolysaccharide assembly outer membrane protein LptD (OstA)
MARSRLIIPLFLCFLFCWSSLTARQTQFSSEEITIIARYWEKEDDLIAASGNVEVHYQDVTILADGAEVDVETKDVFAWGNVTIRSPEEVVSCDEIRFNLDSTQGELKNVVGMVRIHRSKEQGLVQLWKGENNDLHTACSPLAIFLLPGELQKR